MLPSEYARQFNCIAIRISAMNPGRKAVSRLRSTLAYALILWCAGAGCMMVSYAHDAAMSEVDAAKASIAGLGHASGSMRTHDCCKARHPGKRRVASSMADQTVFSESSADLEKLAEVPNSSNAISCCPLISGSIVIASRPRVSNDGALLTSDVGAISSVLSGVTTTPVMRLPNQKQTYLRGCVFLI